MKDKIYFLLLTILFSLFYAESYCQDSESLFKEGTALIKNNKFYEASVKLEECLKVSPEHMGCACNLGAAYAYKGEYRKAIDVIEKVMYKEDAPSRGILFFNLGSIYGRANNSREEKNYYDLALHLLPYFSQVYANLGSMCYMNDEPEKGLNYIMQANSMDSYMPDMQPEIKVIGVPGYMTVGTTDKSAHPLMYLYHSPAWYFTLAINYVMQNKFDNASAVIDKAEQALDKESVLLSDKLAFSQLYVYRATLSLFRGDIDKALEEFGKGYKANSDDLGAICGMALIYFQRSDYDSALKYYYLGSYINPDFPGIVSLRKALTEKGKLK